MNPVVEGARGLAAFLVLLHHYSYHLEAPLAESLAGIHFFHNGVELFFVVTGFLFAPYLLGTAQVEASVFAIRRAFRLYPLYVVSLVVSALFAAGAPGWESALAKHLVFIEALPVFTTRDAAFFSLVYWTLPVEVAFYLLVAAWLRFGPGRTPRPGLRLVVFGVVALTGFGVSHGIAPDMRSERWLLWQAQLPALLLEFWFGIAMAWALPALVERRGLRFASLAAGAALFALLYAWYPQAAAQGIAPRPFGVFNIASALGYALVLGAALGFSGFRAGTTAPGPVARFAVLAGGLSYGVYLFHGKGIAAAEWMAPGSAGGVKVALGLVLTLAVSWLLHRVVELPLRTLGRRLSMRAAPVPAAVRSH